jgi:hypothetical protein
MSCQGLGIPHVVRAPQTPLYQLGWIGQDGTDSSLPDFSGLGPPVDSPILGPIDLSLSYPPSPDQTSVDTPVNPNSGVVYGPPGPGQPGSAVPAPSVTSSITSALTSLFRPAATSPTYLPPGPSPRVAVPVASSLSLGSALPILAVGAVAIVLVSSLGGGRRRRR